MDFGNGRPYNLHVFVTNVHQMNYNRNTNDLMHFYKVAGYRSL